jgi:UDP-glucose 4-epimerase
MSILVTGGAGYIGSHMVLALCDAGEEVVVLDDLSTGVRGNVDPRARLVTGDVSDQALVLRLIAEHGVRAVVHFAAKIVVPDSVTDPLDYYLANTAKTRALLAAVTGAHVPHFVFSSTAAVYGNVSQEPVGEDTPALPVSPYGASKLMSEWMLRDVCAATPMRSVVLRYFNVAGSDPQVRIGQSTKKATLLVKVACEAAVGKRPYLSVFGTDFPTPDGTGVRDYIHVDDLAAAHLKAIDYLRGGGASLTANCGYGHGYSVREVLQSVEKVAGTKLVLREEPRRAGDPPSLVARCDIVRNALGWTPKLDDIDTIVRTSLEWERRLQREPW